MGSRWTVEEVETLEKHYYTKGADWVAGALGRTEQAVFKKAHDLRKKGHRESIMVLSRLTREALEVHTLECLANAFKKTSKEIRMWSRKINQNRFIVSDDMLSVRIGDMRKIVERKVCYLKG